MGGESWPVRATVVCGTGTSNDLPKDFLLVLVPFDLDNVREEEDECWDAPSPLPGLCGNRLAY